MEDVSIWVVLGTIFGGICAVMAIVSFLRKKEEPRNSASNGGSIHDQSGGIKQEARASDGSTINQAGRDING